jgi:hypothetical protein
MGGETARKGVIPAGTGVPVPAGSVDEEATEWNQ